MSEEKTYTKEDNRRKMLYDVGCVLSALAFVVFLVFAITTDITLIRIFMILVMIVTIGLAFVFGYWRIKLDPSIVDWINSIRMTSDSDEAVICELIFFLLLGVILALIVVIIMFVDIFKQLRIIRQ